MPTERKIPLRKCIGCNQMKPKSELIRAVKSPEGEISLDFTGKKNGRGCYICKDGACLKKAIKNGRMAGAFRCAIPPSLFEEAEEIIKNG